MPRLLVIKTSSLGDLVHCLCALQEAHWHEPDMVVDWVSEEGFAAIPKSCDWVDQVHTVALRRWRRALFSRETHAEIRTALDAMQAQTYDMVIDAQGLLKSAWLLSRARVVPGGRWGFDWSSAREPLASLLLDHKVHSSPQDHAVARLRTLFSQALGYRIDGPLHFHHGWGNEHSPEEAQAAMQAVGLTDRDDALGLRGWAVLAHGSSRPDKEWPEAHWVALGKQCFRAGLLPVYPWGSPEEYERAMRLSKATQGRCLPRLALADLRPVLRLATLVVGVDSGITHWAAALGRPTVGLFTATPARRYGLDWAPQGASLEGPAMAVDRVTAVLRGWELM